MADKYYKDEMFASNDKVDNMNVTGHQHEKKPRSGKKPYPQRDNQAGELVNPNDVLHKSWEPDQSLASSMTAGNGVSDLKESKKGKLLSETPGKNFDFQD